MSVYPSHYQQAKLLYEKGHLGNTPSRRLLRRSEFFDGLLGRGTPFARATAWEALPTAIGHLRRAPVLPG